MGPKSKYRIAEVAQGFIIEVILLHVPFDFWNPKGLVTFYSCFHILPIIAMPKLTIDKNGKFIFLDDYIWSPR